MAVDPVVAVPALEDRHAIVAVDPVVAVAAVPKPTCASVAELEDSHGLEDSDSPVCPEHGRRKCIGWPRCELGDGGDFSPPPRENPYKIPSPNSWLAQPPVNWTNLAPEFSDGLSPSEFKTLMAAPPTEWFKLVDAARDHCSQEPANTTAHHKAAVERALISDATADAALRQVTRRVSSKTSPQAAVEPEPPAGSKRRRGGAPPTRIGGKSKGPKRGKYVSEIVESEAEFVSEKICNVAEATQHKSKCWKATASKCTKIIDGACANFVDRGYNMSEGILALASLEYPQCVADALERDVLMMLPLTELFANEPVKLFFKPERGKDIWQIQSRDKTALVQVASRSDGGDVQGELDKAKVLMWLARSGACKVMLSTAKKLLCFFRCCSAYFEVGAPRPPATAMPLSDCWWSAGDRLRWCARPRGCDKLRRMRANKPKGFEPCVHTHRAYANLLFAPLPVAKRWHRYR